MPVAHIGGGVHLGKPCRVAMENRMVVITARRTPPPSFPGAHTAVSPSRSLAQCEGGLLRGEATSMVVGFNHVTFEINGATARVQTLSEHSSPRLAPPTSRRRSLLNGRCCWSVR